MLSNSLKVSKTERTSFCDDDDSLKSIEFIKGKLEVVLDELMSEKYKIENKFMEEKKRF